MRADSLACIRMHRSPPRQFAWTVRNMSFVATIEGEKPIGAFGVSTSTPAASKRATIADLERIDGKAELIDGRIVRFMPTGYLPNYVASQINYSLKDHRLKTGQGYGLADNIGFRVPPLSSGRESFSPNASYFLGDLPKNLMKFIDGAPTFAAEVRSEGDYGPAAELELSAKRSDYFEAGTLVVWDVNPIAKCVHVYRPDSPTAPLTHNLGQEADAEPAVPGWRVKVDWLFE